MGDKPKSISSRELIQRCGQDPDKPLTREELRFPSDMRMRPATDAEGQRGLNELIERLRSPMFDQADVLGKAAHDAADALERLTTVLAGMTEALEFYADRETWFAARLVCGHRGPSVASQDGGYVARSALQAFNPGRLQERG